MLYIFFLKGTFKYIKKSFFLYAIPLIITLIFTSIFSKTSKQSQSVMLDSNYSMFLVILKANITLLATIYVVSIFTSTFGKAILILNGSILGYYLGLCIVNDIRLVMLIAPHGLFEAINIILMGIVIYNGVNIYKESKLKYLSYFMFQSILTVLIAIIEAYVTTKYI